MLVAKLLDGSTISEIIIVDVFLFRSCDVVTTTDVRLCSGLLVSAVAAAATGTGSSTGRFSDKIFWKATSKMFPSFSSSWDVGSTSFRDSSGAFNSKGGVLGGVIGEDGGVGNVGSGTGGNGAGPFSFSATPEVPACGIGGGGAGPLSLEVLRCRSSFFSICKTMKNTLSKRSNKRKSPVQRNDARVLLYRGFKIFSVCTNLHTDKSFSFQTEILVYNIDIWF